MADCCERHGKEFEMFCTHCPDARDPMCSICMCEHIQNVHHQSVTHISKMVDDSLEKLRNLQPDFDVQKRELKQYGQRLEEFARQRDSLKGKLQSKLHELRMFCKKQSDQLKDTGMGMSRSHEAVVKEIAKCSHQLNSNSSDPERAKAKIEEFRSGKRYWLAYREASRVLQERVRLDDSNIKSGLNECEEKLEEFNKQLKQMEGLAVLNLQSYEKVKQENATHLGKYDFYTK